jgi:putative phage-type endonuclease
MEENTPKKYDFNQKFKTNEEFDKFYDDNRNNPEVIDKTKLSKDQQFLFDQYEFLINLPQPVQKSPEWFALRNNMITASSCGSVLGECKYQSIKETIMEKIFGKEFKENKFVYHGKKYEKIATMIYEVIYNSKVGEFGLIPHQTINFLGASPDGVSMSLTLDGKPNKLLGRMLEIKCPPSRVIQNTGCIKGDICPAYYWIQVQIQLECCNLPECDFWQTHLIEYKNEKEFIADEIIDNVHTHSELFEQDDKTEITEEKNPVQIDERIRRGAIIELLPIDRSNIPKGDLVEWYGKYIYPPTLLMTPLEYRTWAKETIKNIQTLYPEFNEKYKFSRVVYWKLLKSHNELITRQPTWFLNNYNTLKKFWDRVVYYREHTDEAKEDIINQRLSNEVFLLTETEKLPKIKSVQQFKKDNVFIKSEQNNQNNRVNQIDIDVFASSSEIQNQINVSKSVSSKSSKLIIQKNKKDDDIFASSEEPINTTNTQTKIQSKTQAKIQAKIQLKNIVPSKKTEIIKRSNLIDEFESSDEVNNVIDNSVINKISEVKSLIEVTEKAPVKSTVKNLVKNPIKSQSKTIKPSDILKLTKTTNNITPTTTTTSTNILLNDEPKQTKVKTKKIPNPEPVYKDNKASGVVVNNTPINQTNVTNNDIDDIDVVFIMENRKKKKEKK